MMGVRRAILVAAALLVLAVAMAGCGGKVVAKVNGEKISREEYYKRLERLAVPTQMGQQEAGVVVLNELVNERIIAQLAKKEGVPPTEKQIEYKTNLLKRSGNLARLMRQGGLTEDEIRKRVEAQQSFINFAIKGIKITKKQSKGYYDKNINLFRQPNRVRVRMIITTNEKKAKDAAKFLKRNIAFETIARDKCDNPDDRRQGGAVALFQKGMRLKNVPQAILDKLVDVAFATKKGLHTDPFQVQGSLPGGPVQKSWIILKVEDVLPAVEQDFPDVDEYIRETLAFMQASGQPGLSKRLADFDKKAAVEVEIDRYKTLLKNLREMIRPTPPAGPMPTVGQPGSTAPSKK